MYSDPSTAIFLTEGKNFSVLIFMENEITKENELTRVGVIEPVYVWYFFKRWKYTPTKEGFTKKGITKPHKSLWLLCSRLNTLCLCYSLVGVQKMTGPTGKIFKLNMEHIR